MYLKRIEKQTNEGVNIYYVLVVMNNDKENKIKVEKFINEAIYNALLKVGVKSYDKKIK